MHLEVVMMMSVISLALTPVPGRCRSAGTE